MKRPKKASEPLTAETLKAAALRYLDRFDASRARLRQVLKRRAQKAAREGVADLVEAERWIDEVLERLSELGLLDDKRFAENLTESLSRRGASRKRIALSLRTRGVQSDVVDGVLREAQSNNPDAELERAKQFVRKRRLGPYRPPEEQKSSHRKDLAALARAGFDYELARRVIGPLDEDAF